MANRQGRDKVKTRRRVLLDLFTEEDLERWSSRAEDAQRYSDYVYFDLERQRAVHHDALCDALRNSGGIDVDLSGCVGRSVPDLPYVPYRCDQRGAIEQAS